MHILRLLAARRFRRRAVSTIRASATAPATPCPCGYGEDEGPFFDLDLSCCSASAPASSAESSSESEDSSCAGEVDFVILLQRSCSASPSYDERLSFSRCGWGGAPPPAKFCASEPSGDAARFSTSGRGKLRTLSFGSAKAAYAHGSPDQDQEEARRAPSADAIRRCLSKISRRLRRVAPGAAAAVDVRLRKSRSVSAAQSSSPARRDDSLLEQQDGIAGAIAHCKESIHRASMSERDSSLLRSRSDPGT
ncbi:unnamed protein product [Triticum turgidum subsp. durum]|uniref:Uncharacterized protein n=1 Tax=Triticum turgidum subsp. durum TaxID=4567 RepID=A0A9R0RKK6_TRITD|nr:unnamed protein product [Triticum turgidum subsp. durum]